YVVAIGGKVYQIVDTSSPAAALSTSSFVATPASGVAGDVVTYALVLRNTGGATVGAVQAAVQVPAALAYVPNSLQATAGTASVATAPALTWLGVIGAGQQVTVTYRATVKSGVSGAVPTTAQISPPDVPVFSLVAPLTVRASSLGVADPDFFLP